MDQDATQQGTAGKAAKREPQPHEKAQNPRKSQGNRDLRVPTPPFPASRPGATGTADSGHRPAIGIFAARPAGRRPDGNQAQPGTAFHDGRRATDRTVGYQQRPSRPVRNRSPGHCLLCRDRGHWGRTPIVWAAIVWMAVVWMAMVWMAMVWMECLSAFGDLKFTLRHHHVSTFSKGSIGLGRWVARPVIGAGNRARHHHFPRRIE